MGGIIVLILIIPVLTDPHVIQEVKIGLIILLIVIFVSERVRRSDCDKRINNTSKTKEDG